jgi:hypothetical protein
MGEVSAMMKGREKTKRQLFSRSNAINGLADRGARNYPRFER